MISTVIDNITPANEKQKIKYRSFKNLDVITKDQIVPLNQKEFSLYFYIKDHSSNLPSINNDHIM
jgi:hypothetical protein